MSSDSRQTRNLCHSIWYSHTPCGRFTQSLSQTECESQMDYVIGQLHLIFKLPLWKIYTKSLTEGVWISNGLCDWATLFDIHTPPVEDLHKVFDRGSLNLKWIMWLGNSVWYSHSPCGRFTHSLWQGECESQMDYVIGQLHLISTHLTESLWQGESGLSLCWSVPVGSNQHSA